MSDNEFDAQRDHAEEAPDNLVLTGEEIELPGEDSDASAIIGESSKPIHTGEIEAVAIGGLTGRVPAAAPLKPTIEDKISTGELPVVSAPEGDLPVVSSSDEADSAPASEQEQAEQESPADAPAADQGTDEPAEADAPAAETTEEPEATDEAPSHEDPAEEATEEQDPAQDTASDEPAPASSNEEGEQPEADAPQAEDAENSFASLLSPTEEAAADEAVEDATEDSEPAPAPVMTPAQAAAALSEANDEASDTTTDEAPSSEDEPAEDEPAEGEVAAVGGAAAEASTHSPSSRRSMIFGDDETLSPSIPAVAAQENAPAATSAEEERKAEEATPFTEPTAQLSTQDAEDSYAFEDQDAAEAARPRRRSLLGEGNEDSEAATLAAIASTAARGDKSGAPSSLDDELFSAAPEITEMPSRTGAHWLSFLLFLLLVPVGWYLAADAGARMTLADAAPMYTGVASIAALGEILGAIVISAILFMVARRSSLGAWLMGIMTLIVGLPWLMAPGITAASALAALTALTNTGPLGANLSHHLQASGYSGRFALLGIALIGLAYVSHSARRTGRAEEALRTSLETTNPAGAFYSKRARKKAAKDAARK